MSRRSQLLYQLIMNVFFTLALMSSDLARIYGMNGLNLTLALVFIALIVYFGSRYMIPRNERPPFYPTQIGEVTSSAFHQPFDKYRVALAVWTILALVWAVILAITSIRF